MIVPSVLAAADPVLSAFDRYVRDNLARPFQVGDAAQALGISERTLQRATSGALGLPPIRYVQQVRIDHAVHLLRTTDRSLDRIAETVGYRDAATLRNLIRRRRGATVSELRRRTRGS
jgi:transcriptional regulator GlxA family with amidase domain